VSGSVGNETLQDMIEWRVASVGKANFEKEAAISGVSSADQTLGETVIPFSVNGGAGSLCLATPR